MNPVVLIGKRKAAVEAVAALGYTSIELDETGRPEQAPYAFGGYVRHAMSLLREQCGDVRPLAVLGVAEGSVPVAAAIRAHFGMPGISPRAAWFAHDKLAMKGAVHAAGIPCASWLETTEDTCVDEIGETLGYPLVLKVPVSSGGRGVRVIHNPQQLSVSLAPGLLAEGFIRGTEMSVESFQLRGRLLLRNPTKYVEPGWASMVPAELPKADADAVNALASRVHETLELNDGITHMEIFLTKDGPVFGEIAARPPGGRLMNLLSLTYDFDPWKAIVRMSVGENPHIPVKRVCFAAAYLLYPEYGEIRSIEGLEQARAMPGVMEIQCHARPGDIVGQRLGTGQTKGHVIVTAADAVRCEDQLRTAAACIQFQMRAEGGRPR